MTFASGCGKVRLSRTCCTHVVCQHQIEVEIWPAAAEVLFRDERYANPLDTKIQFHATVYNAPSDRVMWQVTGSGGRPGAGVIDPAGLYIAPPKGTLPYGFSEIVTATSVDDPFRKAHARVVVIGLGPEPRPPPKVEVYPQRASLYYPEGVHNAHIDASNTMQLFRAALYHANSDDLEWLVDASPSHTGAEFFYKVTGSGPAGEVSIEVRLQSDHSVKDEATVSLLNYSWPGIT